ncbi:MAG: hypothetical protein QW727_01015 [Candidatus Pacearchaeota archaeon]
MLYANLDDNQIKSVNLENISKEGYSILIEQEIANSIIKQENMPITKF